MILLFPRFNHRKNAVLVLTAPKLSSNSNNTTINSNNTSIHPVTIVLGNRSQKERFFHLSPMTKQWCLLLFILLSIILATFVIAEFLRMTRLESDYENKLKEQMTHFEWKLNRTAEKLHSRIDRYHKQSG